jgi:hypothetical protein
MGRAPCCDKASVKRGPWSPEEDEKLRRYVQQHGIGGNWIVLPQKAGRLLCRLVVALEVFSLLLNFALFYTRVAVSLCVISCSVSVQG